jgi:hypothetical protein
MGLQDIVEFNNMVEEMCEELVTEEIAELEFEVGITTENDVVLGVEGLESATKPIPTAAMIITTTTATRTIADIALFFSAK